MIYSEEDLETKYWPHVAPMMDDRGCHEWTAGMCKGYGVIGFWDKVQKKTIPIKACRIAWEIENGPIPILPGWHGGVIRHMCHNRSCVNPNHLKLGTQKENIQDSIEHGSLYKFPSDRYNKGKHFTVCRNGHTKSIPESKCLICEQGRRHRYYMKSGK